MPYVRLPGGFVAHVKMAKQRRRQCCGTEGGRPCPTGAGFQCDFQMAPGKTCDAWCCDAHAREVGPDVHHCPAHAGRQGGLFRNIA